LAIYFTRPFLITSIFNSVAMCLWCSDCSDEQYCHKFRVLTALPCLRGERF